MKIYCLVYSVNEEPYALTAETSYFTLLEEGEKAFNNYRSKVEDDYTLIYLEELDTDTLDVERKMMFEGTLWGEVEEEDESDDE